MEVDREVLFHALLVVFDLAGTFVFALSGGMDGVKHRLDLFGVLVLSFAAGNSGGIARDVLIGAVPPSAVSDWRYLGGLDSGRLDHVLLGRLVYAFRSPVMIFDAAAGLALFAVAGTGKALADNAGPGASILLGMLTGIGGGIVRDLLVREIPTVLQTELYAVAALIGATVMVIGRALHFPLSSAAVALAVLCFVVRYLAIRRPGAFPLRARSSYPKARLT